MEVPADNLEYIADREGKRKAVILPVEIYEIKGNDTQFLVLHYERKYMMKDYDNINR